MHLSISIGLPEAFKIGDLTGGDAVRGICLLILVKSVSIVLIPYSIYIFIYLVIQFVASITFCTL